MTPPLSQLDATPATERVLALAVGATAGAGAASPQRFSQVRTALIRALRSSPEAREPLCDALEQLEAIQQELEAYRREMPPSATKAEASSRRRTKTQEYEVQASPDGSFLVERRAGHSQPFRCPRATYDAAAEVLAAAAEALPFEDLVERLDARTGARQPDYRLRVALRFWMARNAVVRSRTKYRAADRSAFGSVARRLWAQLEEKSALFVPARA